MVKLPVCLLGVLVPGTSAMMFRSASVISHWDTWGYFDEPSQAFYAFCLVTEKSPGEGFLVATSQDGVHWTDRGYVFHKPGSVSPDGTFEHQSCPDSVAPDGTPAACSGWQGTGSVWRTADGKRFVVNFSQKPNKGDTGDGGQNISFATSTNLLDWEWIQDDWFGIDTEHYKFPGRWDCIQAVPVPGAPQPGPVYGFWTGSPKGQAAPWGFGRSEDGVHWTALPPPQLDPPTGGEIGGVEAVVFGSPAQTRYYAMIGQYPNMVVYSAEAIEGTYTKQIANYRLLTGSCYFSRFFRGPGGALLVTHQHQTKRQVQQRPASQRTPGYPAGRGITYLATYKEAMVDDHGIMRLFWWKGNEALKGDELTVERDDTGKLSFKEGQPDVTRGLIIQGELLPGNSEISGVDAAAGITIDFGAGQALSVLLGTDGVSYLADVSMQIVDSQDRDVQGQTFFRILLRGNLLETYAGEYLGHVWAMPPSHDIWPTGHFSVAAQNSERIGSLRAWQMSTVGNGLALESQVRASSQYPGSYDASFAVDANPMTRWCSGLPYGAHPEYLTADLGEAKTVTWFRIEWELAFATSYNMESSMDNVTWNRVFATSDGEGGVETHSLALPTTGRYFRLVLTAKGLPDQGYSLWDWQLHGDKDQPDCGYWETCHPPLGSAGASILV